MPVTCGRPQVKEQVDYVEAAVTAHADTRKPRSAAGGRSTAMGQAEAGGARAVRADPVASVRGVLRCLNGGEPGLNATATSRVVGSACLADISRSAHVAPSADNTPVAYRCMYANTGMLTACARR